MKNESGIVPVEFKVLIKPDTVEQKTAHGIIIPDETHDREGWSQVKGTLIATGGSAFTNPDWHPAETKALQAGTRVYFAKYQGILMTGADGNEYRLCNDKDIGAVIETEAAAVSTLQGRTKGGMAAA